MGTPEFAVVALKELIEKGHEIIGIFTKPDKPFGRKQVLKAPEVKKFAMECGIKVFQPKKIDDSYIEILKELAPDVVVVVAYGKILPKEILKIPKYGCFNIHASLLPQYRGASPIYFSLINGDDKTGISIISMTENLDDGDILKQVSIPIDLNDSYMKLSQKLSVVGGKAICDVLKDVENGEVKRTVQDETKATYVSKVDKDMARIDFNKTAFHVHKLIHALSSGPVAYCVLDNNRLNVYDSVLREEYTSKPGEILDEKNFIVGCSKGAVEFLTVQMQGRKKMSCKDFLNGYKIELGKILS